MALSAWYMYYQSWQADEIKGRIPALYIPLIQDLALNTSKVSPIAFAVVTATFSDLITTLCRHGHFPRPGPTTGPTRQTPLSPNRTYYIHQPFTRMVYQTNIVPSVPAFYFCCTHTHHGLCTSPTFRCASAAASGIQQPG